MINTIGQTLDSYASHERKKKKAKKKGGPESDPLENHTKLLPLHVLK